MHSPNTHKCRSCIRSAKTPACPCISPAATPVTGFALQPSDSDSCHQSHYYRSCRHKSISLCDYSHCYNRNRHTTAFTAIIRLVIFSASHTPSQSHTASHFCGRLLLQQLSSQVTGEPMARELVTRQLSNPAWLGKSMRNLPEASGTSQELVQACIQARQARMRVNTKGEALSGR